MSLTLSIPDLIDRVTIAQLKHDHGIDDQSYPVLLREFRENVVPVWPEAWAWYAQLLQANAAVWKCESALRCNALRDYNIDLEDFKVEVLGSPEGRDQLLRLAAIGQAALRIREANRERIAIRDKIVDITGEGFHDLKKDHLSVPTATQ